ncbi:hypothetical protein NEOC95_000114 [Neochlamydia sp. AcF95]|nr:hypothetical protein [Neochlamydia sp. AcF95]
MIPYLLFTFDLKAKTYMQILTLFNKHSTNFSQLRKRKKPKKLIKNFPF